MELTIVIALLGVVGLSFGFLYSSSQRFLVQSINASSSQGEASFALEHIRKNLLLANAVASPAVGNTINLQAGDILQFTWIPRANQAALNSRYRINAGNLEFDRDNPATEDWEVPPVARGIIAVTIVRTAQASFDITLQAQRVRGNDTRQIQLQTVVNPRGL